MTKAPLISVVIPAYNHERFIGPAVESVLAQSLADLELIIIDDGSTDGTAQVIQSYQDSRLHYTYQENQDAYNALNRGMGLAQGEYIAILNSDDVYTENRLERLLAEQRATNAQCLFSRVRLINDGGTLLGDPSLWWNQWYEDAVRRYRSSQDLYLAFLQRNVMVTTSNLFLTRQAAEKVGGFSALRYLHDYDYIFRVLLAFPGQVQFLHEEALLFYRIHGSNTLSEAAITGRKQDQDVIRKYMLARIPQEFHTMLHAGIDRLMELEQELMQEQQRRANLTPPALRTQLKQLARSSARKLRAEVKQAYQAIQKDRK
ncbi:MAG: glycosyltransferase [Desulfobulbaceae bacterium]|nr:glycosyltransferase [Desulfobulbaceae bacterium]